ncbi:MAG: hypothetical protein LUH05_07035 [Candidatus Gastranaerophilales bacterium]|nr:hypothetical protein [Candidatus Gastranaerophilales bacterium]
MITDTTKITENTWQHKRNSIGETVTGIEDIKQCIDTILTVSKGDIPLMPELGTDIIKAIGENAEDAIDIAKAIFSKEIPKQEPRAELVDISGTKTENGRINLKIQFKEKTTGITETTGTEL